jgi:hypothetical protein
MHAYCDRTAWRYHVTSAWLRSNCLLSHLQVAKTLSAQTVKDKQYPWYLECTEWLRLGLNTVTQTQIQTQRWSLRDQTTRGDSDSETKRLWERLRLRDKALDSVADYERRLRPQRQSLRLRLRERLRHWDKAWDSDYEKDSDSDWSCWNKWQRLLPREGYWIELAYFYICL